MSETAALGALVARNPALAAREAALAKRDAEIIRLSKAGLRQDAIRRALRVSRPTVSRVQARLRRQQEVAVPAWVPTALHAGYRSRVRVDGDDTDAASWARQCIRHPDVLGPCEVG